MEGLRNIFSIVAVVDAQHMRNKLWARLLGAWLASWLALSVWRLSESTGPSTQCLLAASSLALRSEVHNYFSGPGCWHGGHSLRSCASGQHVSRIWIYRTVHAMPSGCQLTCLPRQITFLSVYSRRALMAFLSVTPRTYVLAEMWTRITLMRSAIKTLYNLVHIIIIT